MKRALRDICLLYCGEFDDCGVTYIYSEAFDTPQMGQAIMNRLMKAAGQKKITGLRMN